MPQDAFTLKVLCNELNQKLVGGKINKIVQVDNDNVLFTIYANKTTSKLLISVNPSMPRIGLTNKEYPAPLTAPNFCMLLRKHLLAGTIEDISLIDFDRIVKIDIAPSNELFDLEKKTLYVELMGRYSNLILTQKGIVLGGNRGINVFDNGVRPLFVGKKYNFPPVGDKKSPSDKSLIDYFALECTDLVEHIIKGVQGLAVSTAREIVESYGREHDFSDKDFSTNFFNFFNSVVYNPKVKPCVYENSGEVIDVCVFPYTQNKGNIINFNSLVDAEEYYYDNIISAKLFKAKKERLLNVINANVKRQNKKLTILKGREREASSCEENRIKGELLLANIYKIKQGDKCCELENYYDNSIVKIQLDTNLSPAKNAEKFYKKYNKQKRTLVALKPQMEFLCSELLYLESVLDEIEIAEDISSLDCILDELKTLDLIKDNNKQAKRQTDKPFINYKVKDYEVKVGRNNTENDRLCAIAQGNDIWLHVKDYHSAHVIISCHSNALPPEDVIRISAEICAYYSKARSGGKVEVVYTKRKHVKKVSGSKPGFVKYDNFQSINILPNKNDEFLKTN